MERRKDQIMARSLQLLCRLKSTRIGLIAVAKKLAASRAAVPVYTGYCCLEITNVDAIETRVTCCGKLADTVQVLMQTHE